MESPPWNLEIGIYGYGINSGGDIIADDIENEANAAHIVKAVNEREGLIEALRTLLHSDTVDRRDYEHAEAILAKAEAE